MCARVRDFVGAGEPGLLPGRGARPRAERWVLSRRTRRPDPIPAPREKSDRLMLGLADTQRGNPTRLLARSRWVFAPGNGAPPVPQFLKKFRPAWPTSNRAPVMRLGTLLSAEPPLRGGGWPSETTVKAGRLFLIRIGSGLRRFAYSGQPLEVDLLSPLSNPCCHEPRKRRRK
jgi:hypothetical protein